MTDINIDDIVNTVTTKTKQQRKKKFIPTVIKEHIKKFHNTIVNDKKLAPRKIQEALLISHPDFNATLHTIRRILADFENGILSTDHSHEAQPNKLWPDKYKI